MHKFIRKHAQCSLKRPIYYSRLARLKWKCFSRYVRVLLALSPITPNGRFNNRLERPMLLIRFGELMHGKAIIDRGFRSVHISLSLYLVKKSPELNVWD
jgi:hypothetical protein